MPDAFGFGAAGQGIGSFLEGLLRGKADRAARESQTRQERLGRIGTVLSLASNLMERAENKDLVPEEKNRLYQQGKELWEGAVELFGTVMGSASRGAPIFAGPIPLPSLKPGSKLIQIPQVLLERTAGISKQMPGVFPVAAERILQPLFLHPAD